MYLKENGKKIPCQTDGRGSKGIKGKNKGQKTSKMILRRCQILLDMYENHGKVISRSQCTKANSVCQAAAENTLIEIRKRGVWITYTNNHFDTG